MRFVFASKGAKQFRLLTTKNTSQSYRNSAGLEEGERKRFKQEDP